MSKTYSTVRERLNQIDLIRNGSVSPLASGDNAPIGSRYFGPGGEPWLKTGAVATAWIQQLMMASVGYLNVKTFGAVGNGIANDRTAIGNAITAAQAQGGGVVFFPPGTYNIVRTNSQPIYLLTGEAQGKILFLGCGRSSVLSVSSPDAGGGDMELFQLRNGAKYLGWKSLCFNGEQIVNPGEQSHMISWFAQATSLEPVTGHSFIIDCYFDYTEGDAIRLLGNQDKEIRHVHMARNCFQMRNTTAPFRGGRSCVGYQRAVRYTNLDANYMTGVRGQLIDYEPSGAGVNIGDITTRNFLDGEAFSGISNVKWTYTGNTGTDEHTHNVAAGNTLIKGGIQAFDLSNTIFANNIILSETADEDGTMEFSERINGVVVAGSIFVLKSGQTGTSAMNISNHSVGANHNDSIAGNIAINNSDVNGGFGITIRDMTRCLVTSNMLFVAVNTVGAGGFIRVEGPDESNDNLAFMDNLAVATDARVGVGATIGSNTPFSLGNAIVAGSLFRNLDVGVRFGPDTAALRTEQLCATRNILASNVSAVVITGVVVPDVIVDAGGGPVGPTIYQVTSSPEAAVAAAIGSVALRTNGGALTTLYVKEANSGLNTGWTAK